MAEVLEQAGGEARRHRHAQDEAYYVLSGHGVLDIDGVEHPLAPGSTAFIPGHAWHAARGLGPEPLRLLYVFPADSFAEVIYEFPDPAGVGRIGTSVDEPVKIPDSDPNSNV